jgi:hypothetical protein
MSNRRAPLDPRDGLVAPPDLISSVLLPDLRETLPELYQLPAAARASFSRARSQSNGPGGSGDRGGDKVVLAITISGPESMIRSPVTTSAPNRPSLSEPHCDFSLHAAARPPPLQKDAAPALAEVPDLDLSAPRASFAYDHAPSTYAANPSARMYAADPSLVELAFERPIGDEPCSSRLPNEDKQASGRAPDSAESA